MTTPIRILFVEDSENDMLLELRALRKGGYEPTSQRVQTAADFERAVTSATWDLILMDFSMPTFSTPEALKILNRLNVDCPTIVVSGTVGEDIAVDTMRIGAHDYILKDNLKRLVPAVRRELVEFAQRREQRKTAAELESMRARFKQVVDCLLDIVIVIDRDQRFVDVFGDCFGCFHIGNHEFLGKTWLDLVELVGEDRGIHRQMAERALAGAHVVYEWSFNRGGETRYMQSSLSPARMAGAEVYGAVGVVRDITEQRHAEEQKQSLQEQLRQAQKMEAIGQLAGGVAHDFNNLMTVVIGYGELLLNRIKSDDPNRASIEAIAKAGRKATTLTRQLLAFSRKQPMAPKVVDLNLLISDAYKMLRRLIEEHIQIEVVPAKEKNIVRIDPGSLDQVLMNLAVNARDAMPQGGRLIIETDRLTVDEEFVRNHIDLKPGPYALLAVSDTGTGMDAETLSRIFEPFFTTKPIGKGTGLGLATVYGVVKQCGGGIWVYSEPGRGTSFKIYFPAWEGDVDLQAEPARVPVRTGVCETVLLVEDGEEVRRLTEMLLVAGGYRVLSVSSPIEAIKLCEDEGVKIDLLLTDVIMPEMSGKDLAEKLRSNGAEVRVLYMSGYTDNVIAHHGVLDPGTVFLEKPFTSAMLLKKVREALGDGGV